MSEERYTWRCLSCGHEQEEFGVGHREDCHLLRPDAAWGIISMPDNFWRDFVEE